VATRRPRVLSPAEAQAKADFKAYWEGAEKGRLSDPVRQRPLLASAHKYAICFTQLSRAVAANAGENEAHKRIFLQELSSDSVHLVHALIGGDARGGRFYLRSVIENFWRHHYFRDHPVEYGWLHTRSKYYLEMKALREHCSWLDIFQGRLRTLLADLSNLYGELSSAVHSTSSKTLILRSTLEDIKLSVEHGSEVSSDLLKVLKACLTLCIYSERLTYFGMHVNVQDFLIASLGVRERAMLTADSGGVIAGD